MLPPGLFLRERSFSTISSLFRYNTLCAFMSVSLLPTMTGRASEGTRSRKAYAKTAKTACCRNSWRRVAIIIIFSTVSLVIGGNCTCLCTQLEGPTSGSISWVVARNCQIFGWTSLLFSALGAQIPLEVDPKVFLHSNGQRLLPMKHSTVYTLFLHSRCNCARSPRIGTYWPKPTRCSELVETMPPVFRRRLEQRSLHDMTCGRRLMSA